MDARWAIPGAGCALALSLLIGCSAGSSGGKATGDAGPGAADAGASAGGTAGTGGATAAGGVAGAITTAPPAWIRPADCLGVGNACPNLSGCEAGSICQSVGDVCIPAPLPGNLLPGKSAERPYCAAYTCMTFDEASCFCTGEAAASEPACSSPKALAGLCGSQGQPCDTRECCGGFSCVDAGGGRKVCEVPCAAATDCPSGCCTDLRDTGALICAEKSACDTPCKRTGEACTQGSATTPNDCCRGACVESTSPDFAGCRPLCTKNVECPETGCCQLFTNATGGFCAPALYCTCGAAGAPCGQQGTAACCDGNECVGATADTLECSPRCTTDADCPAGCCVDVTGATYRVCAGPSFCP